MLDIEVDVFSQQCISTLQWKKILFLMPCVPETSIIFTSKISYVAITLNLLGNRTECQHVGLWLIAIFL